MSDASWFEDVWAYREENLYPSLFGPMSPGIFTIPSTMFTQTFRQDSFDPRWLHVGVFESPPNDSRPTWLYVSSGLSNEWWAEKPDSSAVSGIGNEFIMETLTQAAWAIHRLLHVCTFQILLAHNRFKGREILEPWDRIPLRSPIDGQASVITYLWITPGQNFPKKSHLDSGYFYWNHVIGISESEAEYARNGHSNELIERLKADASFPLTKPDRPSSF